MCPRFSSMSTKYRSMVLLGVSIGYAHGQVPSVPASKDQISISFDAAGYSLTLMALCAVGVAHLIFWLTRLIKANTLNDNKAYLVEDGITQRGFRRSWFGSSVKYAAFCLQIWLIIAMIMTIVGKYSETWPFDPSIPTGMVDTNSYVRAFVASWMGSVAMAIVIRTLLPKVDSFYHRPCSLTTATHVKFSCVVVDPDDVEERLSVKYSRLLPVNTEPCRHINFLSKRYTWSSSERMFTPGSYFPKEGLSEAEIRKFMEGLNTSQVLENLTRFGTNHIDLEVPTFSQTLVKELSSVFYLYQFSIFWFCMFFSYITYAIVVMFLVISSSVAKVRYERHKLVHVPNLLTQRTYSWVKRDSKWTKVVREEVSVGDLVCLTTESNEAGFEVAADMLIVGGDVVADETNLSGDTVPVRKRYIPHDSGSTGRINGLPREFRLFTGTHILHAGGVDSSLLPGNVQTGCLAVVTAVGGDTMHSQLARRLLMRKPLHTPFRMELLTAVTCLVLVSFAEFLWVYETFGVTLDSVMPALVCVLGIFNPLLIFAFVLAGIRSLKRLESSGIYVRSLDRIALAGKINLVLMDKTGTITKSGLDLVGLVPADSPNMIDARMQSIPWPNELSMCVAMAHSVVVTNGKLVGDQIELRMIECSSKHGWKFEDIHAPTDVYGSQWEVLHTFPFNHQNMCMSVLVRQRRTGTLMLLCKGSFEAIRGKCPTIPDDAAQCLRLFSQEGHYILAAGTREIDPETSLNEIRKNRNLIENDLTFAGLMLFSNEVKAETTDCIRELNQGGIDICLLTGDSPSTACSVARSAGIVSDRTSLIIGSVDGQTGLPEWRCYETDTVLSEAALLDEYDSILCITGDLYEILVCAGKLDLTRTKIYARFNPSQKGEIVRIYADVGKVVSFCGDSGNDTFALQASHVGLAIRGNAGVSNASSFSTEDDSLTQLCVLIREGRANLCNTLASYRFLIVFGIFQTLVRIILLTRFSSYSTAASNLLIDCITVPLLLVVMSEGKTSGKLFRLAPEGSLMGPQMILGCIWSLLVVLIMYSIATVVLTSESWYVPFRTDAPVSDWSVRTSSFDSGLVALFRFWISVDVAFAYSYGSVHRSSVIHNWRLVVISFLLIGVVLYTLASDSSVWNCTVGVNCTSEAFTDAFGSRINWFLFKEERVGGVWNGPVDSLIFPSEFRLVLLSLLILMTIIHHTGFKLIILGRGVEWIHKRLGWTDMLSCCGCCCRRNPKGYKRLSGTQHKETVLNDSIMSASGDDSPAVEWHMRRAQGAWRVPEQLKYG